MSWRRVSDALEVVVVVLLLANVFLGEGPHRWLLVASIAGIVVLMADRTWNAWRSWSAGEARFAPVLLMPMGGLAILAGLLYFPEMLSLAKVA